MAKFSDQFIQGLLNPSYSQGLFEAAKGVGATPGIMMAEKNRVAAQDEVQKLLQQYANDPKQLRMLAQKYAVAGDENLAKTFEAAAQTASKQQSAQADQLASEVNSQLDITKKTQESVMLKQMKDSLATTADKLNMPELARAVRMSTDKDELADIAKEIRKAQIKRAPSQTVGQRLQRALSAGFSKKEFDDSGMGKSSDEIFEKWMTGQKGDTEAWVDGENNIAAYRFNQSGKVYNEATQTFVEPSVLGLVQKAPSVQKVLDASSKLGGELQKANADDIIEQRKNARAAVTSIQRLDRQLARVGSMPTGIAANLESGLKQVGQLIGMPYDEELVNAQTYMIEAATFVKEQIKAFGSGTGLSDKDLQFTERMVGADPTVQAATLEKILGLYRQAAVDTVQSYNKVINATSKQLSADDMVGFYPLVIPESEQPALSTEALKYIPQSTGG
jgi:hypothetical protein